MRQEKLSSLLDISIGRTPSRNKAEYWGDGYPWVSIRDLNSKTVTDTKEQITDIGVKNARCKLVKKGTLLFSFKLTIGKMAFAGCDLFTNEAIAAFSIKDVKKLNSEYLYYALKSATYGGSNQAVMGKTLNLKSLAEIKIPLPSFDDQIRIAYLLGKVEGLITQRKQHLQQLDDLLKSVFLEMFGDPVRNEKDWDIDSLSRYGSFKNGLNFGKGESGVSVRYLGVGNFKAKAKLEDIDELSFIKLNELPSEDYFLKNDDLLFVRSNGNRELVGRCMAVYPADEKVTYSGFIIRYRIETPDLNPTYIAHLFRSIAFRRILFQGGQGANIQNINQQILAGLPIPIPPQSLQNHFAISVEKVEALKSRVQQSLNNLESLYGALGEQAFKGRLDLSKLPLPDSKNRTNEVAAISVDLTQTLKSSERVISQLNKFNSQHAVFLEALNNMPALKIANSPVFKAARELSEQAALWRTPLDQFRNMNSVARAAAAIATAINIPGVNNAAFLAQQIASAIPKMDMAWLKDQQAIINTAIGPFSEMRQAIAAIQLPDPEGRLTKSESAVSALQATVPSEDVSVLALAIQQDDNENEPRYIFTRDDILQVLSGEQPLSVIDLMSKLAKLEVITPEGYSRIKTLLFSLLAERQIQQQYNDEENAIAFRTCA